MLPAVSAVSCIGGKSVKKFRDEETFLISGVESLFPASNRFSPVKTAVRKTYRQTVHPPPSRQQDGRFCCLIESNFGLNRKK